MLNEFLRFWLVFCFLDFGFVVVLVGGGGVVVDDGDGCDEREADIRNREKLSERRVQMRERKNQ